MNTEEKTCEGNCPNTCREHGGKFVFCTNGGCMCHERRKPIRLCRECGSQTYYKNIDGSPSEVCQNCAYVLALLDSFVKASNAHVPITGRPRKLTITGYKIERV